MQIYITDALVKEAALSGSPWMFLNETMTGNHYLPYHPGNANIGTADTTHQYLSKMHAHMKAAYRKN